LGVKAARSGLGSTATGVRAVNAASVVSGRNAWPILFLLTLIFTVNCLDRSVMIVVIEPVKHEFHLKDGQLGLLTGLVFGATYAVFAIPLGALADRLNRRNLLAALLVVWSCATVVCGVARNFTTLLFARMLVGAAESGASPCSNSMIGDLFPPNRRATAIAIFNVAPSLGAMIAFLAGSWIAVHSGWRAAFILAGVPGIVLAAVMFLMMPHPKRGAMDGLAATQGSGGVLGALRSMFCDPVLLCVFLAITFTSLVTAGFSAWYASVLIREHAFTLKQAGSAMAFGASLFGGLGVVLIGGMADWFARGRSTRLMLFVSIVVGMTFLNAAVALTSRDTHVALAALCGFGLFHLGHIGPGLATLINATPNRNRGVVIAAMQISGNFIGAGIGPWIVGALSDTLGGPHALSRALLMVLPLLFIPIGLFLIARRIVRIRDATAGQTAAA
jgi:predicted MFS family arabinose efflux permease